MRIAFVVVGVVVMAACARSPAPGPVEERFTVEIGVVPGVSATAAIVHERATWIETTVDGQAYRIPTMDRMRTSLPYLPVDRPFDQAVGGVITNGRTQTLRLSGIISGSATQPWQRVTLTVTDAPAE